MKRCAFITCLYLFLALPVNQLMADDSVRTNPWEKFSLNVGAFVADANTVIRFGSGGSLSVDVEEALGLDAENTVFRLGGYWRFSSNRKHRLDFSWFSFNRNGDRTIADSITIDTPDQDPITIPGGTRVESKLDLDIYQAAYSYSFIQDQRLDLSGQFGLYIMPIDFGLSATGFVDKEADQSFTAPLPAIGMRTDIVLAPKWFLRSGTQVFYAKYSSFTGAMISIQAALEYNPFRNVGFGLGFDAIRLGLQNEKGESYPGIDLKGEVHLGYTGLVLYSRVYF